MLHSLEFDTVPEMHDEICQLMMLGKPGRDFDWIGGPEVGITNLTIGVRSFAYEFDFKTLFHARTRWNMMVRQYINPDALDHTLSMVETHLTKSRRGIATIRMEKADDLELSPGVIDIEDLGTNLIKSRKVGKWAARRWGSCMLSMTYRVDPTPTVTLNSRTTYFGMLAMMDVTVANVFARMCAERTGVDIGDIQFVWQLNLAQWHGFRSLAWALTDDDMRAHLETYVDRRDDIKRLPGLWRSVTGYRRLIRLDREGKLYGDETFASALRMRKRFHIEVMGAAYSKKFAGGANPQYGKPFAPLPHLWSQDLDFSILGANYAID